jgi:hypothetical protein
LIKISEARGKLTDYVSSHHTYPTAQEISKAQDAVKQQNEALTMSRKRKRAEPVEELCADHVNNGEGAVKKKKGAVEDYSRRENEKMLKGLFISTRNTL